MNPATFTLIFAGMTALGSFLGVVLSGMGKRGDRKAQTVSDNFKRLTEELTYWHTATLEVRTELEECQADLSATLTQIRHHDNEDPPDGGSEE